MTAEQKNSEDAKNKWEALSEEKTEDTGSLQADSKETEDNAEILTHPDYQALQTQLTESEEKAHEQWEQAMRTSAELDNVRKRAERDVANALKYGPEKIIKELLPVIDSLEQALSLQQDEALDSVTAMREGLELTLKLFLSALEKFKVVQLNPTGEIFDPNRHEAMSMLELANAVPNTVIEVFQKGYLLNDRVIRPARVIVAKG